MPKSPRFLHAPVADPAAALQALAAGLQRRPAAVPPKYFYDRLGSALFDAITLLPEYTPTHTEAEIFASHGADIAAVVGGGATLVDLGAGSCTKAAGLFALLDPRRYIAVDISAEHLHEALRRVQREHPGLDITGVAMDFADDVRLPAGLLDPRGERPWFFYPGSSIGNFTPDEALVFLRGVHAQAAGGGLIIGVDLVKPAAVLDAAYDDALGITAAFNLNLLRNLNRLLGCDFEPAQWRHVAFFDADASRVEMHLEAREDLRVRWPTGVRHFVRGERLHTENSYKYTPEGFETLLHRAGFSAPRRLSDPRGWFALVLAPA